MKELALRFFLKQILGRYSMILGQNEIDTLIDNCKNNKAGLEDVKGFKDKQPTIDLLSIVASSIDQEELIGGKDDW